MPENAQIGQLFSPNDELRECEVRLLQPETSSNRPRLRNAVPCAAVVFPFPSPVLTKTNDGARSRAARGPVFGGVVRFRPDGSNWEVYTTGTRNHLDISMNAEDEIFSYDNTDDGLGWNTRFTHLVDGGFYGYPYDYRPRDDDARPLARRHDAHRHPPKRSHVDRAP